MNGHTLKSDGFEMTLWVKVYETDVCYPVNATVTVSVRSDGFSASVDFDVDIKLFAVFARDLKGIYDTLSGSAKVEEAYGQRYVSFSAEKNGHIGVKGYLCDDMNKFSFENSIDQTCLKSFADELDRLYSGYSV